jgi:leucyl-tRNA synthetase
MSTGLFVTHPLSGEKIPVWVANCAHGLWRWRGDGVPGHDERDFTFAEIRLADQAGDCRRRRNFSTDASQPWYEDKEHGRCVNSSKATE